MSPLHLGVGSSVAQYRRLRTRAGDGPVHSSSAEGWRGGSAGPPPVSNSTSTNSSKPNSNGAYNLKTVTSNGNGPGGSSSSSSGSSGSTLWRTPGAPPRRDPAAAAASTAAAAAAAARLGAMGPAGAAAVAAGAVQVPAAGWGAATGGVQSVRRQAHAGGHSLRGAWRAWLAWMAQLLQYRLMVVGANGVNSGCSSEDECGDAVRPAPCVHSPLMVLSMGVAPVVPWPLDYTVVLCCAFPLCHLRVAAPAARVGQDAVPYPQ